MAIHVFIPTLQGVSHVQSIVQEDVDVPSVVCLDGTAQSLPISNAYYDFVKKGQGVIAKDFGHEAWRVDLSEPVEMGNSWQLGIYLAHYFHSKGELGTGEPKPGDTVIWATGSVKVNRDVEPVEGVERKLAHSSVLFEQLQQQQIKTLGVMCEANHTLVELPSYLQAVILSSCGELSPLLSELNIAELNVSSSLIEKTILQPANVNMQYSSKQKTNTQKKPVQKIQPKPKAERPKRSSYGLLALVVVAGLAISAYGLLALNSSDKHQDLDKTAIDDTQHFPPPAQGMFVDDAKNLVDKSDSAKVMAKAVLASNTSFLDTKIKSVNQNCDQAEGRQFKPNDLNHFKPQALSQLCELSIHFGDEAVSSVYLYLLDANSFLPLVKAKLVKTQTNWAIPLPKNRSKTRKALVLGFDNTVTSDELKKLNRFLAMNIENEWMNAQDVQTLLAGSGYKRADVFGLTLEQF